MDSKVSQIPFELNNGKSTTLSDFGDKVIMVVNVASECGLTHQYEGLEKIYEKYKDQGFLIVGFPSNEFGAQEPGTNEDIHKFCQTNYGIKFPLAKKIVVKGEGQHVLYEILTKEKAVSTKKPGGTLEANLSKHGLLGGKTGDIMWNFEKFLIDKNGNIIERFAPDIAPEDTMVINAIELALNMN
jgi:glutathione peroxidase